MSSNRATRLAELRALRASGKKRGSTYEVEDQGDIYDEVDDDGYKKVIRSRLDEDDFVVDDNGAGYADDGREVWNENVVDYSSDDSDELPARGKAAKRKREEEEQRKEKMNNGISRYFNNAHAAAAAPKSKVSWCPVYVAVARLLSDHCSISLLLLPKTRTGWRIFSEKSIQMSCPITSPHRTLSSLRHRAKCASFPHLCPKSDAARDPERRMKIMPRAPRQ